MLFDIDWQGGNQLRKSHFAEDTVSIFVLPPSIDELVRRLRERGRDSERVLVQRMEMCRDEISHWSDYDFVLINNRLDEVLAEIKNIVKAETPQTPTPVLFSELRGRDSIRQLDSDSSCRFMPSTMFPEPPAKCFLDCAGRKHNWQCHHWKTRNDLVGVDAAR